MSSGPPPSTVWCDLALQPEARALLVEAGLVVVEDTEPDARPPRHTDALIVGSRYSGNDAGFAALPRLRVLARVGAGHERIDIPAATRAGVCVVNTPDAPTESTAEFTIALLLAATRLLPAGHRVIREGDWQQDHRLVGADAAGKTLGLVGCGRIGRRVAEIARALRMRVIAHDPFARELPDGVERAATLAALLSVADFISLHAPAPHDAPPLLGAGEFAVCKPGAMLINTARGSLVDPVALLRALDHGPLAAAAVDVWDAEPPAADHPLRRHPRVLGTPHMAAFTHEGKNRSHLGAARQTLQVLRDERPPALVNPSVWDLRRRGPQRYPD